MIQDVAKVSLPVDETLRIRKNRIAPKGGSSGKRISVVTGIHGDELEGQYVCYEIIRRINEHPECLKGTVDIYPALNPLGIDSVMRGIPAFDLDMNRIFPGRGDGDMNEYVAAEIIRDLEGSGLCLDIHASNIYLTEIPQIRINELHEKQLVPLAKLSNVDFIWVHGASTVLESTLAYSLNSRNVPTLVVEMGVGMRITKEYGDQLTDGIFRLMQELGIWEGEKIPVRTPVISRNPEEVTFLNAPVSGIFIKELSHGTQLVPGMRIGKIVNPLSGELLGEVTSPVEGWLFTVREYPVVDQGSLVARILTQMTEDGGRAE
ncbi:MAG: succinylglutamate desuccinylase/aspartoacylase family protein [Roseburia sp.]|nr:succinylglutamate desuccinylase/aspartoacylase family protein [Roseburia sp.]